MMITTASNIGNIEVETILLQKSWQLSKLLKREGAGTLSPVTGAGVSDLSSSGSAGRQAELRPDLSAERDPVKLEEVGAEDQRQCHSLLRIIPRTKEGLFYFID